MRWRHRDGSTVHLAYCTNVHPAEDFDGVLAQLERFAAPIRRHLGVPLLGVGLWLAQDTAVSLAADPAARRHLRDMLDRLGLEVVTLNGFPYRAFHAPVVKHDVYRPDWSEPARADYTISLGLVLADLLPDDVTVGSISTLPLAWRDGWSDRKAQACRRELLRVAQAFADLQERTGKTLRIALEPEPGCVVETTAQGIAALEGLPRTHLGLCVDIAHLAVQFEDPAAAVAAAQRAGVPVVKSQLSCALRATQPDRQDTRVALADFAEPRFLHQTRAAVGGAVHGVDDLDIALAGQLAAGGEWRVHFHSAIHTTGQPPLGTTQDVLAAAMAVLVGGDHPVTHHLEVETYTWTVLPPDERPADDRALAASLAAELQWARQRLAALGLEELS